MSTTPDDSNTAALPLRLSRWLELAGRLVGHARSRPHLLCLAAIFLLALALRLAWIAYANPDPHDGRFDDSLFYDHAAQALAAGEGYTGFSDQQTAQWPPGYPLLLAAIYKVFGHSILAAKVLNAFAGAATCLLIYAIATKVFNRRVGLLAALMLALFPGQVYFSTLVMTESIFPALLALLLLLVVVWTLGEEVPSPPKLFLLGVLFGAVSLIRGEAAILLLVVLLVWKLAIPSWRKFALQATLLVVGAALAIMPWTIRNAITMNEFVPLATGWGHTLLAGHQSDPYGHEEQQEPDVSLEEARNELMRWLAGMTPGEVEMWTQLAEQSRAQGVSAAEYRHRLSRLFPEDEIRIEYSYLPFPEREIKVEREAFREGLDFMVSNPKYEVKLLGQKFYHLYEDDSAALEWIRGAWVRASEVEWLKDSWVESLDRVGEPVVTIPYSAEKNWSRLANGYYYAVMIWALGGLPLWFSFRDKKRLLLVLFLVGWTLVHLIFLPGPRYHAPLIPIFCLWAALPLVAVWERAAARARLTRTGFS